MDARRFRALIEHAADYMVVATGTSQRHLASMADKLIQRLKEAGVRDAAAEGAGDTGWVLIDALDVIIHLFRAETRSFYEIEKLWTMTPPTRTARQAGSA